MYNVQNVEELHVDGQICRRVLVTGTLDTCILEHKHIKYWYSLSVMIDVCSRWTEVFEVVG